MDTLTIRPSGLPDGYRRVDVDGVHYLAAYLAGPHCPPHLAHAAIAPVLRCSECGDGPFSALDLYDGNPVPGECRACVAELCAGSSRRG